MPQLLFLLLVGLGIWLAYRWYRKEQNRVRSVLRNAEDELEKRYEKEAPKLKRDPKTGVYKPSDDG